MSLASVCMVCCAGPDSSRLNDLSASLGAAACGTVVISEKMPTPKETTTAVRRVARGDNGTRSLRFSNDIALERYFSPN